jgi:glycosyltransferase involved in cell wall biosynthesis
VIAGSGDLLEELVMTGAYEQLSKYMIFTGFIDREDVNTLLATSDIYFMPSVSEPFGLTALEAARAGVSCVITKQSGAAEVLFSALKADFWDTDKFAMQIIELLKDDTKRLNISIEQKKEISRVSWNTSAEKIVSEYYKLLN